MRTGPPGFADTLLPDEEREQIGPKLFRLQSTWEPGQMVIVPVVVPDPVNGDKLWQENHIPALVTFVNIRSFLLLDGPRRDSIAKTICSKLRVY